MGTTPDKQRPVTPCPMPHLTVRNFDDELVIMDTDTNIVRILNEVGARIWQLADGTRTIHQISEALVLEYDVTLSDAEHAVQTFVDELTEKKLFALS